MIPAMMFNRPNYEGNVAERVDTLENNETIFQIFTYVGTATSGQVTLPAESTIFDVYGDGIIDAIVVEADVNQNPTEFDSLDSSGKIVQVTSLLANGDYTLDAAPVKNACIIYFIRILDKYRENVPDDIIIPPTLPIDGIHVKWVYPYIPGEYPSFTMTRIGDWTAISNKLTSDYPVPQYSGEEFNVYDGTMDTDQAVVRQLIFGTRYLATSEGAYVKGYRIYTVVGNTYAIYSVEDPLGAKIFDFKLQFTATENGWIDISVAPTLVTNGSVFDIIALVQEPNPTPVVFSGSWNYSKPTNPTAPSSGQITHSTKVLNKIDINYIDNLLADRTVDLQSLNIGDTIDGNEEIKWAIQAIQDFGTYIEFTVAPSTQLVGTGLFVFEFETKVATPITYGIDTDYYLSNPNVAGLFVADDGYDNISVDDNAYGMDLLVQELNQSEDWDIVASSANLGGAGNKKATDFLAQVEVTTEGDDEGVIFHNQLSAKGEIIAGEDSYPVPIAFHCKDINTVGKVITGAVDITTIVQSDAGSSIGLFGGVAVGDYILIGSPYVNEGAKVKYDTLNPISGENILPEYYESDIDGWLSVPFMGTNSSFPFQSYADTISNSPQEQIFFGFNPLTRDQPDTWATVIFNINGVDYNFKWAKITITSAIAAEPIVEQIKLHTDRIELEKYGIFKFGRARSPIPLPFIVVKNDLSDPANEAVSYTPNYSADYIDNEFANGTTDGFGIIINRVIGLDTSVPLTIGISFYVKGAATGDIELNYEVSQIIDQFIYNGTEPFDSYSIIETIAVSQNLVRFSVSLIANIDKLNANAAIVVNVFRNASAGNPNDTLAANIVRTNINVTGFAWKV